jgi:hypothetical protein
MGLVVDVDVPLVMGDALQQSTSSRVSARREERLLLVRRSSELRGEISGKRRFLAPPCIASADRPPKELPETTTPRTRISARGVSHSHVDCARW